MSTSQASLERVLREHIEQHGGKIELGVELVSLEQKDDRVIAHLVKRTEDGVNGEEVAEFAYLVGADGAKGA